MRRRYVLWLVCLLVGSGLVGAGVTLGRRSRPDAEPKAATRPATERPAQPIPPSPRTLDEAVAEVDVEVMLEHVRHLSETIGPRVAGSKAEAEAAGYVAAALKSAGCATSTFTTTEKKPKLRAVSVIGKLVRPGKKVVVVAAHHDSAPGAPGANDNASGVAVLLEVARVLCQYEPHFSVIFASFGGEETKHVGSRDFCRQGRACAGMLNLDMVGVGNAFLIGTWRETDQELLRRAQWGCEVLGHDRAAEAPFGGKGDYASFVTAGIPVVCYAWDEDSQYHTANDTLSQAREAKMRRCLSVTAQSVLAALLEVADDKRVTPVQKPR